MTRHLSEVDSHHTGPFAGLGSRHHVTHWGDGAKEARIACAHLRRPYYYLTGMRNEFNKNRKKLNVN